MQVLSKFKRKMSKIHFSVVVPAYNAADTLDETLASLRTQTFPMWEAIIVDDGSTDSTATIAYSWAQRDNRFRVILQSNGGESAARNTGIRAARNDWLVFLDSDDWLAPQYLERMAKQIAKDPKLDAVVCSCVRVTPSGQYGPASVYTQSLLSNLFPEFVKDCPFALLNCVVRCSLVQEIGEFDTGLVTCADWDFWQRVARTGARFGNIPEVLTYYRMRPGSASSNAERILVDGLTVIRRGHDRDPRVRFPHPDYANGLSSNGLSEEFYRHSLWPVSHKIVRGEDARPLLQFLEKVRAPNLNPLEVATCLFKYIPLAANRTYKDWPILWPTLAIRLNAFLSALEAQSQVADLAKQTILHIERLIVNIADLKQPITIGTTHKVRINIDFSIEDVKVQEGVEQLICAVESMGQYIGSIRLSAFQRVVSKKAIAEAIENDLALPLMLVYFRIRLPRDNTLLHIRIRRLTQENQPLRIPLELAGLLVPVLRWQLRDGLLREPLLLLRFLRLVLRMRPVHIAIKIIRTDPESRRKRFKEFLINMGQRLIREQKLVTIKSDEEIPQPLF